MSFSLYDLKAQDKKWGNFSKPLTITSAPEKIRKLKLECFTGWDSKMCKYDFIF